LLLILNIKYMEVLNIEIINPKAKMLLMNLAEMNLIQIKSGPTLSDMLTQLRRNESKAPSFEEITKEVETVRQARYDNAKKNNY
jgi:hypothetical protein